MYFIINPHFILINTVFSYHFKHGINIEFVYNLNFGKRNHNSISGTARNIITIVGAIGLLIGLVVLLEGIPIEIVQEGHVGIV
jgi:hypothetical protein